MSVLALALLLARGAAGARSTRGDLGEGGLLEVDREVLSPALDRGSSGGEVFYEAGVAGYTSETDCHGDPSVADWVVVSKDGGTFTGKFMTELFKYKDAALRTLENHPGTAILYRLDWGVPHGWCRGNSIGSGWRNLCKSMKVKKGFITEHHKMYISALGNEDQAGYKEIKRWFLANSKRILNPQIIDRQTESQATPGSDSDKVKPVHVVIDNKSPRDLEHVVVLHKYVGKEPLVDVMAWDTVPASAVSGRQQVYTIAPSPHRDWWQVSFRFKKRPLDPCGFAGSYDGGVISVDCSILVWEDGSKSTLKLEGDVLTVNVQGEDIHGWLEGEGDHIRWDDGDVWKRGGKDGTSCIFAGVWDAGTISANCTMVMGVGVRQPVRVEGDRIFWGTEGDEIHGVLMSGAIQWSDGDKWVRSSKEQGEYIVDFDGLPVNADWDRESEVIARLAKGTRIQVVEVPVEGTKFHGHQGRVRARISQPAPGGWVSLRAARGRGDKVFATKVVSTSDKKQCPVCETEDGVCETHMSYSSNAIFQAVTDPRFYIRSTIYTGAAVAGAAITAASWGSAATLGANVGVGIAQGALDAINFAALEDYDTSEFFSCSISSEAIEGSINEGRPMHLVLTEETDEHGNLSHNIGFEFEEWNAGEGRLIRYQKCSARVAELPCQVDMTKEEEKDKIKEVAVSINNTGSARITRLALVHKYQPTGPHVLEWVEGVSAGATSRPQDVSTMTDRGVRTIGKSDWWMAAWQDEKDPCLVKSTLDLDFMRGALTGLYTDVFEGVALMTADIATGFIPPAIGTTLSILMNSHASFTGRRDVVATGLAQDLFGADLVDTLSTTRQDKNGMFIRCNFKDSDVNNSARGKPVSVEVDSDTDTALFRFGTHVCSANVVVLRCIVSSACSQKKICQELLNEPFKNISATGVSVGGLVGGVASGVTDIAGNIVGSEGGN